MYFISHFLCNKDGCTSRGSMRIRYPSCASVHTGSPTSYLPLWTRGCEFHPQDAWSRRERGAGKRKSPCTRRGTSPLAELLPELPTPTSQLDAGVSGAVWPGCPAAQGTNPPWNIFPRHLSPSPPTFLFCRVPSLSLSLGPHLPQF